MPHNMENLRWRAYTGSLRQLLRKPANLSGWLNLVIMTVEDAVSKSEGKMLFLSLYTLREAKADDTFPSPPFCSRAPTYSFRCDLV